MSPRFSRPLNNHQDLPEDSSRGTYRRSATGNVIAWSDNAAAAIRTVGQREPFNIAITSAKKQTPSQPAQKMMSPAEYTGAGTAPSISARRNVMKRMKSVPGPIV